MAQLFFKYGAMNAGKSIDLLKTAHNYEEQGKNVVILTSALDTRAEVGKVSSRIGLEANAIPIDSYSHPAGLIGNNKPGKINCVLIDEAQFLTEEQVIEIADIIVDAWNIPVICFGLKTDFQGKLFEGSKALFENADKLEEIKTVCQYCDKKATFNLRTVNGKPEYTGNQIQIGDQEYISVCRKHYYNPPLPF